MCPPAEHGAPAIETHSDENGLTIVFHSLAKEDAARLWADVHSLLDRARAAVINLDLARTTSYDTSGIALIASLRSHCARRSLQCRILNAPQSFEELLGAAGTGRAAEAQAAPLRGSFPETVAEVALSTLGGLRRGVSFVGEVAAAMADAARHPRRVRWADSLWYMQQCGAQALPITALICFLMGVIMAFQAAVQLHDFGADIYVADLVGLSITRELGPLMVAIICAGRSGAAFAAEIGTMKVGEEVDALLTMGLDPYRFLVVPKVFGLLVALPCLSLLGDFVGVLGGLLIGTTVLDLPAVVYLNETLVALSYDDVFGGLIKSVVFALVIAGVGCYYGFQTGKSAQSVGRMATAAVVSAIFFIILIDAGFSVVYHTLGM